MAKKILVVEIEVQGDDVWSASKVGHKIYRENQEVRYVMVYDQRNDESNNVVGVGLALDGFGDHELIHC